MLSSRHSKRLGKKEGDKIANELKGVGLDVGEGIEYVEEKLSHVQDVEEEVLELMQCDANNGTCTKSKLNEKLRQWSINHRVSRACSKDLIKILKEENVNVSPFYKFVCPIKPQISHIAGGDYLHIGLEDPLRRLANVYSLDKKLNLDKCRWSSPFQKLKKAIVANFDSSK